MGKSIKWNIIFYHSCCEILKSKCTTTTCRLLILDDFVFICRPSIKIPVSVMMPIAHLVEFTYKLFSRYGMRVPQLTPSRIRLLSCNRTFSCTKARVQLDYEPIVPLKVLWSTFFLFSLPESSAVLGFVAIICSEIFLITVGRSEENDRFILPFESCSKEWCI